jgi:NAD(P)-dependent dehydrogenase (short-subunit alcohol dehydrogenase family)
MVGRDRDRRHPVTRTAIITGASSGIGKATATLLAQQGDDLGLTWTSDEPGIEGTVPGHAGSRPADGG